MPSPTPAAHLQPRVQAQGRNWQPSAGGGAVGVTALPGALPIARAGRRAGAAVGPGVLRRGRLLLIWRPTLCSSIHWLRSLAARRSLLPCKAQSAPVRHIRSTSVGLTRNRCITSAPAKGSQAGHWSPVNGNSRRSSVTDGVNLMLHVGGQ